MCMGQENRPIHAQTLMESGENGETVTVVRVTVPAGSFSTLFLLRYSLLCESIKITHTTHTKEA